MPELRDARSIPQPPEHPEMHRRFALLRSLIFDERQRHRLVLSGAVLALLVVVALTILARLYTVLPFDVWFTLELQALPSDVITQVMYVVSVVGYTPWSAVAVVGGALLVSLLLGWREGLYLLSITLAQGLLNALIKRAIGRPRPIDTLVEVFVPAQGFSFPSGHVMFYTVFFGFLLFLVLTRMPAAPLRWLLAVPLAGLVLLVGPSRIILGAHWLSDVIAAYLLGMVILVVAIEAYLHILAPPSPAQEHGLMRRYDEQREARR
jgi:membrane-associated phospholipid phosphatase